MQPQKMTTRTAPAAIYPTLNGLVAVLLLRAELSVKGQRIGINYLPEVIYAGKLSKRHERNQA